MSDANPTIENVVVVMLENRSYDNLFGWLYNSANVSKTYQTPPPGQQGLNGLTASDYNRDLSQTKFNVANQTTPTSVSTSEFTYSATTIPVDDPGEEFENMAQQITGSTSIPSSNPYTTWPPKDTSKVMTGFVYNYNLQKNDPNTQDIMNYFTPEQVPVSAFLANNYAICDTWYSSLPTQTFSNRVFANCAAPAVLADDSKYFSLVDDAQYVVDKAAHSLVETPSVFQALDNAPPSTNNGSSVNWKLYFHDYSISVMTTPYVADVANSTSNGNLSTFDNSDWGNSIPYQLKNTQTLPTTFMDDINNVNGGALPPYALIEPRYSNTYTAIHSGEPPSPSPSLAPNSNHPGGSDYPPTTVTDDNPPIDASSGELFVMQLYNAVRNSDYWDKTLLIITYDEPGGTYDHVMPPASVGPGTINWINNSNPPFSTLPDASDSADNASNGFAFNAYGGRVPAIVVSPFVNPGSTLVSDTSYPFDHASIVRTVLDVFGQSDSSLTSRDAVGTCPSILPSLAATGVNETGAFSGVIIPAPASLAFHLGFGEDHKTQSLQASAGTVGLTVSVTGDWITTTPSAGNTSDHPVLNVEVDAHELHNGTYNGMVSFSGQGLDAVDVPITMIVTGHL